MRAASYTQKHRAAGKMKQLIIAEKPSLARSVIAAIGNSSFRKMGGYFENDRYVVSYAYGHLFGLKALEDYLPEEKKKQGWCLTVLPFFPGEGKAEDYEFELIRSNNGKGKTADTGAKQQFSVLKKLMKREDIGSIVNCGDADREGEVIIRLIIKAGLKKDKPVYRLWLPDQTEETIREELSHMKLDQEYDNLYDEGLCRTIMDWMYGINLSRYLTIRSPGRTVYAAGRVLTPIVKAVADRDEAIENFIPEKYYQAVSETEVSGKSLKLTSSKKFAVSGKADAEELCRKLNDGRAVVTKAEKKDSVKSRGKLFSLSKLQAHLAKKYKMAMDSSLAAVQSLYEKGLVTYPRTNTEYLSENEKGKVQRIIEAMADMEHALYEIFSIHTAAADSDTFTLQFADYEELELWRNRMISLSDPQTGVGLKEDDRVVTLSTCTESSQIRMTVQGKLIWKRDLEEMIN